jgi:hypothetical protein
MLLQKTAKRTQMQILVYQVSTLLLKLSASIVERISRRHAERQAVFTSLGSSPGPRNYHFLPFSPSIFFLLYIQTFFYTNMNIFITLLENVNKSRISANNLSLMTVRRILHLTDHDNFLSMGENACSVKWGKDIL